MSEAVPVAPSLEPALEATRVPLERGTLDKRVVYISMWAILLALVTGFVAQALISLIGLITSRFTAVSPPRFHRPRTTIAAGSC